MILKQILILFLILNLTCCDKAKNKKSEDNFETFGGSLLKIGTALLVSTASALGTVVGNDLGKRIVKKNITNSWL